MTDTSATTASDTTVTVVPLNRPAVDNLVRGAVLDADHRISPATVDEIVELVSRQLLRFGVDIAPAHGSPSWSILAELVRHGGPMSLGQLLTVGPQDRVEMAEALVSLEAAGYVLRVDGARFEVSSLGIRALESGRHQLGVSVDIRPGTVARHTLAFLGKFSQCRMSVTEVVNATPGVPNTATFEAIDLLTSAGYVAGDLDEGYYITGAGQDALTLS